VVILQDSLDGLKRFLEPVGRNERSLRLISAWIIAFLFHPGRMGAVRAAGAIRTEPRHRAQLSRFLQRRFWEDRPPLERVRNAFMASLTFAGRVVFCVDQTLCGHAGVKTENTYSTGNRQRRPRKGRRHSKYKHARRSCHCFVMGLLIFPDGTRVPFSNSYVTKEYCQQRGKAYKTQTQLAAELIAELPLPEGVDLLVLGDTAFDAAVIRKACGLWNAHWITPVNPERVLAGPAPRPKLRTLIEPLRPEDFAPLRLRASTCRTAGYRRVSSGRQQSSHRRPRTFFVHGAVREVKSVGLAKLVFSLKSLPLAGKPVELGKVLISNAVGWSDRMIVEWYSLRWQIELFFKELKSSLGFAQYRLTKFAAVEAWVQLALLTFLSLESHRRRQLRRRGLSPDDRQRIARQRIARQRIARQRTHGLKEMLRQRAEQTDLQKLADRLRTPHGQRRLQKALKQALPAEYRAA